MNSFCFISIIIEIISSCYQGQVDKVSLQNNVNLKKVSSIEFMIIAHYSVHVIKVNTNRLIYSVDQTVSTDDLIEFSDIH